MAAFPGTMPLPNEADYAQTPEVGSIRTDMSIGPARVRRTVTAIVTQTKISWDMNYTQLAAFRTFFHTTIDQGTQWFTMNLFVGNAYVNKTVRFVGGYVAGYFNSTEDGHLWRVSATIEVQGGLE